MGGSSRSHYAPRRCHRIFLPDEHLNLVAWVNYGARWRRIYLFGHTFGSRRNVEARKKARFDKLCGGSRFNRGSQCWVAAASLTLQDALVSLSRWSSLL